MDQKNTWHSFQVETQYLLTKNLSDEDCKYLVKEFGSKNLKILKQKGAYPYEYMNSFKRFNKEKLCARKYFFCSTKKGKIDQDHKISDGHLSIQDYLTFGKVWNKFKMKLWMIIMIII